MTKDIEVTQMDRESGRIWAHQYEPPMRGFAFQCYTKGLASERARIVTILENLTAHGEQHIEEWDGRIKISTILSAILE